jgi:hypothetical protein
MDIAKPNPEAFPLMVKHGQGLRALVEARRRELELELSEIKKGAPGNSADIEAALAALTALLTGDLQQIPPTVAQELSQWIETSKYLGATAAVTKPYRGPAVMPIKDLRELVEERRHQRELELSELQKSAPEKSPAVETALTALKALLNGDLDKIPPDVAEELSQCIETSRYLGTKARRTGQH